MTGNQESRLALVTGATGFIGSRLVQELIAHGFRIRALVRPTSQTELLAQQGCELFVGDVVQDPESVCQAVQGCDLVFHLAAETHAVRSSELIDRNLRGVKSVLAAMEQSNVMRLIYVSSLAAVGPSTATEPQTEAADYRPVSCYGKSKAACEQAAFELADQLSISIVRPPIVLGEGDHNGLAMFQSIDQLRLHFVPGFSKRMYSVIHVDDLARSLVAVAQRGQSIQRIGDQQGIYFAAADEAFSFSQLGRVIGRAMDRRVFVIKVAKPVMWLTCLLNEGIGRLTGNAQYLNLDKFRDAFSGSWLCSNQKLKADLGIEFQHSFLEQMRQTAAWYRAQGQLKQRATDRLSHETQQSNPQTESFS